MKRVLQGISWVFLAVLTSVITGPVKAEASGLDCGKEALLEEGACVLTLFEFNVIMSSSGVGSMNSLSIRLGDAQAGVTDEVDGIVYRAEIADLNGDGRPEVFAYVSSAGSGSYGSVVAYAIADNLQLIPISLQALGSDAVISAGYMGHDEFSIVGNSLVRRFPLYQSGDVNAAPTGGTRKLVYKLLDTGSGWALRWSAL